MELADVDGGGLQAEAEVLGDATADSIHHLAIPTCAQQHTSFQYQQLQYLVAPCCYYE